MSLWENLITALFAKKQSNTVSTKGQMTSQKNLARLIDSILDSFMNGFPGRGWGPRNTPDGTTTYCNFFVSSVCRAMGYGGFTNNGANAPMLANDMIDFMLDNKNGWMTVSGEVAQAHANSGVLVIAGQKSDGHGHVCMVRPGEMLPSLNWGKKAPRVANIGKDVFIDKSASWAFKTEPTFFALKEMI